MCESCLPKGLVLREGSKEPEFVTSYFFVTPTFNLFSLLDGSPCAQFPHYVMWQSSFQVDLLMS